MKTLKILFVLSLFAFQLVAQQQADTAFDPVVAHPAYRTGIGSVVLIDEAHHNFHTMTGRYKPFADVLMKDGYQVRSSSEVITTATLSGAKILVIANALHESNTEQWRLPTPSAFTPEEIAAINQWVNEGGSLFLIADHMPFPGAAGPLAESFGVKFLNGFAMKKRNGGKDLFTVKEGAFKESALSRGRNKAENVTSVRSFTGQAFGIPANAEPIMHLNDEYEILMPEVAWQFDKLTRSMPATDLVQGAYMKYGTGRVVFFGEAAMFTAQTQGNNKFGMNAADAGQNLQLLLNIIHWLDGLID